jgi:hypothetical protein
LNPSASDQVCLSPKTKRDFWGPLLGALNKEKIWMQKIYKKP